MLPSLIGCQETEPELRPFSIKCTGPCDTHFYVLASLLAPTSFYALNFGLPFLPTFKLILTYYVKCIS